MPYTIELPSSITEDNLATFVGGLGKGNSHDTIYLDFSKLTWITPGAVAAIAGKARGWHNAKKKVFFKGHDNGNVSSYLQRFDLFRTVGIQMEEKFRRRDSSGKFVPLCSIKHGGKSVESLASHVASVMVPNHEGDEDWETGEVGAYGYFEYAVSELANNVLQHARADGYVCAQYYPSADMVRVAISDAGIGIRKSFEITDSPHWHPAMNDFDAINTARKPKVSSRLHLPSPYGDPVNQGVGLTLLEEVAKEAGGKFLVLSGEGCYTLDGPRNIEAGRGFQGTLVALAIRRSAVQEFNRLLKQAKVRAGILSQPSTFKGVFR